MDLVVFSKNEVTPVLRALRSVAAANDRFTDAEAALIEAVGRLHGVEIEARALEPISPADLAREVVEPHKRKRAVQLAMVTALVEGTPSPEVEETVEGFAQALEIREEGLKVLHDMTSEHSLLARFDMARRMRRFMVRVAGVPGIFKFALPLLGLATDAKVEARFRSLEHYPEGSLGRALYDQYTEHEFPFPGSPTGMPEKFLFHDVGHVIAGYDVDPQGEIQQAAFQAGFIRQDGFLFLMFGILQFHVGLRMTPIANPETGYFDTARVIQAAARGAACKIDFSDDFDFWAHAGEQVSVLRERWGVPPLAAS